MARLVLHDPDLRKSTGRRRSVFWDAALAVALANLAVVFMGGRWPLGAIHPQLDALGLPLSLALLAAVATGSRWSVGGSIIPRISVVRTSLRTLEVHWAEVILAVLVVVALAIRLWTRDYGLPLVLHPDEPGVLAVAARLLRKGTLDPNWFIYPTLYIYLILPFMALAYVRGRAAGQLGELKSVSHLEPGFLQAARTLSAVAGALTLVPIYQTATTLWRGDRGRRAGLVAAAVVAFSFIHVRESHFALTDTTLTLLLALSLHATARVLTVGKTRSYVLAGLLGGLAGAAKYSALPIVGVILGAHLLGRRRREWLSPRILWAFAGLAVGFLMGAPYALLNWPAFINHLGFLTTVGSPGVVHERLLWMFGYGMESGFGPFIFIATLLAATVACYRRDKTDLLLVLYVVLFVAQVTHARIATFPRYWLPAMPAVALLFASFVTRVVDAAQERFRLRPALGAVLLAGVAGVCIWPTAAETFAWNQNRIRRHGPTLAYEWIVENAPRGTIVATEMRLKAAPGQTDFFYYAGGLHERSIGAWRRDRVDLMVLRAEVDRAVSARAPEERRRRRQLRRRLELIATFPAGSPAVEVYRVRYLTESSPQVRPEGDGGDQ